MATVLDRVPIDVIEVEARQVNFGRTLATLFAAVFFAVGWTFGAAWAAVAWAGTAVRVGFRAGRQVGAPAPPDGGG